MLRTNLSTRPFYNERAVHLLLMLAALLVMLLTAYNAIRIFSLSRENTRFSASINRDRAEAQRLTGEARRVRAGIDQARLKAVADAAGTANMLIDQRTFSWTEFFNHIEATLPPDVMLTAVQPSFSRDVTTIQMTVLGRRTEGIDEFMEQLEATGAFTEVLPVQEDRTEDDLHRMVLRSVYGSAHGGGEGTAEPTGEAPGPERPAPDTTEQPPAQSRAGRAPALSRIGGRGDATR